MLTKPLDRAKGPSADKKFCNSTCGLLIKIDHSVVTDTYIYMIFLIKLELLDQIDQTWFGQINSFAESVAKARERLRNADLE